MAGNPKEPDWSPEVRKILPLLRLLANVHVNAQQRRQAYEALLRSEKADER